MDTVAEETYDVDTVQAAAICAYDAQSGKVILSSKSFYAINPPPRATGFYLWRITEVSGTLTSTDPIGTWVDVNSEGTSGIKEYYLINTNLGAITAQATIEVAEDDGTGNPKSGTVVAKTINFTAEIVGESICFTTQPWTLSNTETNENAEVYLVSVPEGWWDPVNEYNVREAYLTGEYGFPKGIQEYEVYSCDWSLDVQVKVDQISGDPIQGDALGTFIGTGVRRRWWIDADTAGTSKQAVADITYTDGVETVTKRVNMYAEWVSETVDPGSGVSDDFTRRDSHVDWQTVPAPPFNQCTIDFFLNTDGTLTTWHQHGGEPASYPQNWNDAAPTVTDPENFESRITWISGWRYMTYRNDDNTAWEIVATGGQTGRDSSPWQNLATQNRYRYFWRDDRTGILVDKPGTYQIEVREVGRPETVKTKIVDVRLLIQT